MPPEDPPPPEPVARPVTPPPQTVTPLTLRATVGSPEPALRQATPPSQIAPPARLSATARPFKPASSSATPLQQTAPTSSLSATARSFEPASSSATSPAIAIPMGHMVDVSAERMPGVSEFFFTEADTKDFRTISPHAHVNRGLDGRVNISYTSKNTSKISSVINGEHWENIKQDSPAIYNPLCFFFSPRT